MWESLELSRLRFALRAAGGLRAALRGFGYALRFRHTAEEAAPAASARLVSNPLQAYFDAHRQGRGIWKWEHYFDVYQRHLAKFVGREVHILEIGVYSGGSLDLWLHYLGPRARVYGVDIEPACRAYASERVQVFIGDQADRDFWHRFRKQVPELDVVIDDGGHRPAQQIAALEELLPHLRPGGVYLCEDVHTAGNPFNAYVRGLTDSLNAMVRSPGEAFACPTTRFQAWIRSIHSYPYITVIEKAPAPATQLSCPKRGTMWEPFL